MIEDGGEIALPPLNDHEGADDLADAFLAAGMTEPGAMSEMPLSWVTLDTWSRLTEAHLSPGDFETIRLMSEQYMTACEEYRNKPVPAPYETAKVSRAALAAGIRAAIRGR